MLIIIIGARYHTRGADALGHTANFVETEQIVSSSTGLTASYVQVTLINVIGIQTNVE